MEPVPIKHHSAGGAVQNTLHPENKGGMEIWGEEERNEENKIY